jgi:site-specific DNA recombinase
VAKLDQLVDLLDIGTLDGPKVREKAAEYKREIAEIDAKLAAAARTSPTAALLATGKQLRNRWAKLTPSVRSQIIDEIAVVTVLAGRRGERGFNPDYIDITWRTA